MKIEIEVEPSTWTIEDYNDSCRATVWLKFTDKSMELYKEGTLTECIAFVKTYFPGLE